MAKTRGDKRKADEANTDQSEAEAKTDAIKKPRVPVFVKPAQKTVTPPDGRVDLSFTAPTAAASPAKPPVTATAPTAATPEDKVVTRSSARIPARNYTPESLMPEDDKDGEYDSKLSDDSITSALRKPIPKSPTLISAESILQLGLSDEQRKAFTVVLEAYKLQEASKMNNQLSEAIQVQQRAVHLIDEKLGSVSTGISSKFNLDDSGNIIFTKSGNTIRLSAIEGRNSGKQDRHVTPISYLTHAFADSIEEKSTIDHVRSQLLYLTEKLSTVLIYEDPAKTIEVEKTIKAAFDAYRPGESFRKVGGHRQDPENIVAVVFSAYNDLPLLSMKDDKKTKSKSEGADVTKSLKFFAEIEERLGKYNEINIHKIDSADTEKSVRLRQAGVSAPVRLNIEKLAKKKQLAITPDELKKVTNLVFADFDYKMVAGKLLSPTKDYTATNKNDILFQLVRRHLVIFFILCPLLQEAHQDVIKKDFIDLISINHGLSSKTKLELDAYVTVGLAKINDCQPEEKQIEDEIEMLKSRYDEAAVDYQEDDENDDEEKFVEFTKVSMASFQGLASKSPDQARKIIKQIDELTLEFEDRNTSDDESPDAKSEKILPVKSSALAANTTVGVHASMTTLSHGDSSSTAAIALATSNPHAATVKSVSEAKTEASASGSTADLTASHARYNPHAALPVKQLSRTSPSAGSSAVVRARTNPLKDMSERLESILRESKEIAKNNPGKDKILKLDVVITKSSFYLAKINSRTPIAETDLRDIKAFIATSADEFRKIKASSAVAMTADYRKPPTPSY